MYSVNVKFQVSLSALLLIIIVLFNIVAFNSIDSFTEKIQQDHRQNDLSHKTLNVDKVYLKKYIVISSVILFLVTFLLLHQLLSRLMKPVKEIREGLEKVSQGLFSHRIALNTRDEFSFLADQFNAMAKQLETMLTELETAQKDLEDQVSQRTCALDTANKKLQKANAELKATHKQIIHQETQRSLTTIVAGFGHEINNPLTGILGTIDLLEHDDNIPPHIAKKITTIKIQSNRIKDIIDELNQLNPEIDQTKNFINLTNLLEKLVKISRKKYDNDNIDFIADLPAESFTIRGNHYALWQVFEGIIQNAVEAIQDHNIPRGQIHIAVKKSPDQPQVITTITDNAGGFADLDKAFEPFYTTKNRTQKKGIGLSIAYNLIREHKGHIYISNTDDGACLEISLPYDDKIDKINENQYKHQTITRGENNA